MNDSEMKAAEDLEGIREATEQFLRALDDLDWDQFRTSWASEPMVFLPFGDTPQGVAGRTAVEARWQRFFEGQRVRLPGPPYLNLSPRNLAMKRYGDVGLVTFMLELRLGARQLPLQRRTLVWVREHGAWKLVHMHASAASQE